MLTTIALFVVFTLGQKATVSGCDADQFREGCSVTGSLAPGGAVLEGTVDGGGDAVDTGPSSADANPCADQLVPNIDKCVAGPGTPTPTTVTLSDVAAFRPDVGSNAMQPNGWAVVGLDTNFLSRGGADVVAGTLLGGPAEVRFTPVAWTWSYGDGATRRATTAGGLWAELGIPEFDATPTSHVYAAKGTYTITLTIDYFADYRLGSGAWVPIAGVLSLPSNPLTISVGSAKTVLVEDDCRVNPSGPGC